MEKKLDFLYPSIIDTYSGDSGRASIQLCYKEQIPRVIVNHLTISYYEKAEIFGFNWERSDYRNFIQTDIIKELEQNPIEYIIESINDGFYICLFIDHYYIEGTQWYKKSHFLHDNATIYGYNLQKKIFFVADNFINEKYEIIEIPFNQIVDARINNSDRPATRIKLDRNQSREIEKEDILMRLKGHLACTYLLDDHYGYVDHFTEKSIAYGMDIYKILSKYLLDFLDGKSFFDIRGFQLLYNHKSILKLLYEYLVSNRRITAESDLLKKNNEIIRDTNILRFLFLKSSIDSPKKEKLVKSVIDMLSTIKDKEINLVFSLMKKIESAKD